MEPLVCPSQCLGKSKGNTIRGPAAGPGQAVSLSGRSSLAADKILDPWSGPRKPERKAKSLELVEEEPREGTTSSNCPGPLCWGEAGRPRTWHDWWQGLGQISLPRGHVPKGGPGAKSQCQGQWRSLEMPGSRVRAPIEESGQIRAEPGARGAAPRPSPVCRQAYSQDIFCLSQGGMVRDHLNSLGPLTLQQQALRGGQEDCRPAQCVNQSAEEKEADEEEWQALPAPGG